MGVKEIKVSPFGRRYMIPYLRDKRFYQKLLELIIPFSRVAGYKINTHTENSRDFPKTNSKHIKQDQ